jgi:hypothetical protein
MNRDNINRLLDFIIERHDICMKRELGKPKPWTKDPILRDFRFCNVYREHDKVTKWIAENWRDPNADDQDVWFAMLVARYVNEPATLELIGYPIPWCSANWHSAVKTRQKQGANVFNAAYIIPPTAGSKSGGTTVGGPKHEALDRFFTNFWNNRKQFRPTKAKTLAEYADLLCTVPGMGRFFAGQIIADLKYTTWLAGVKDWWTFAISGPGSRRGLNRVVGNPPTKSWTENNWFVALSKLREEVNDRIKHSNLTPLHGQDMQNCLCEFDKYERFRLGEGRPKQRYDGRA